MNVFEEVEVECRAVPRAGRVEADWLDDVYCIVREVPERFRSREYLGGGYPRPWALDCAEALAALGEASVWSRAKYRECLVRVAALTMVAIEEHDRTAASGRRA